MNVTKPHFRKTDLTVTHALAELLERLEHSAIPVCAKQYRSALDASLAAERQAKEVLDRAMSRAMNHSNISPSKEDPTHGKS